MKTIEEDSYAVKIDHSQDVEIRKNKDGKMFAIKNIRQEFEGNQMILKADISGDKEAANQYLKFMCKGLVQRIKN